MRYHYQILIALGCSVEPVKAMHDNQAVIRLAGFSSAARRDGTRRINIRYLIVKDRISKGEVNIEYCPTKLMVADALTKPAQGKLFLELRDLLLGYKEV